MPAISCIICAYNEGARIEGILRAAEHHPALSEVIVIDDGSNDETQAMARAHPAVRVVSYRPNRGKTYAMSRGVEAARGELLMFLDADLDGVGPREIDRLAAPVRAGRAEVAISLRRNSLACYRLIGLDFVSGERVLPAWLLKDRAAAMAALPRWGAEAFINALVVEAGLRIEVVRWPGVRNIRKYRKMGAVAGAAAELRMVGDALRVLSPIGVVRQNLALLRLANRPAAAWRRRLADRAWP